jgi:hypothetical protein
MNKKDIMRQSSMETLLQEMIRHKPGITSARLFEAAKEWAGCSKEEEPDEEGKPPRRQWTVKDTWEFEGILAGLIADGFICTNKQWQEKGFVAAKDPHGPPKTDPRQLRMDW